MNVSIIPFWAQLLLAVSLGGGVFVLSGGVFNLLSSRQQGRHVEERLQRFGRYARGKSLRQRLSEAVEHRLASTSLGKRVQRNLDAADLSWSLLLLLGLWLVLLVITSLAFYLLLSLASYTNAILSLGVATFLIYFYLLNRRDAYERALQAQTPDIAQLMSNSLRAGQSLYFSLFEVEEKLPDPASREFRRLRQQIDLGEPTDQALRNFMERHPGEEMRIMFTSLLVQRRAGGDLIKTLSSISAAIRARRRVRNEVDTITAEARQTSLIVLVLPFVVLIILNRVSPGMVTQFIANPVGLVFFIVVYILPQIAAFFVIRRIGNIKV